MSQNLEIEFKSLLSISEYDRLMSRFSHIKPVKQVNHYFDTPDLKLRENRLSFRIRTFSGHAEMTLKVPQKVGNIEHNINLPLDLARHLVKTGHLERSPQNLSEILDILIAHQVPLADIVCLGNLTTERRECLLPIGLAALDYNTFLGTSDYEFELEVQEADQGRKDFDQFLNVNDIEFRYARSKVVRFLDTLRHKKKA